MQFAVLLASLLTSVLLTRVRLYCNMWSYCRRWGPVQTDSTAWTQLEIKEYRQPQSWLWWQKTHRWFTVVQMRVAILKKTDGETEEGLNCRTRGTLSQRQKCVNSDIINLSYTYRTLWDPIGHCSPEVAHSRFWSMCQQEAINAFNRHKPFFFSTYSLLHFLQLKWSCCCWHNRFGG